MLRPLIGQASSLTSSWKTLFMAVVIMLALQGTSMAVQLNVTWTGGAGNWNNTGNWSGSVVPDNGIDTYNVLIDSGDPGNSSVTLDMTAIIDNLTIDNGDSLTFNTKLIDWIRGDVFEEEKTKAQ